MNRSTFNLFGKFCVPFPFSNVNNVDITLDSIDERIKP